MDQTFDKLFEIIVVDNPTIEQRNIDLITRLQRLRFDANIISSPLGANNARNTGIYSSKYPIIALLDDDCVPCPTWLDRIYNCIKDNVVCVGGSVILDIYEPITKLAGKYLTEVDWGRSIYPRPLNVGEYITSCNMAFTIDTYYKVGGFNANLGYVGKTDFIPNDEILFIRDCHNHGEVLYDYEMKVSHIIRDKGINYLLKRAYGQGYADILLNREQGIQDFNSIEQLYFNKYNKIDILLQCAKVIGITHALKGIKPSKQYYSLLEELAQI